MRPPRPRHAPALALPLLLLAALGGCALPWPDAGGRGRALYEAGRYAAADPLLRRALVEAERRRGPDADDALAGALLALAELRWAQGRDDDALPLLERAAALAERVPGRGGTRLAAILNRWGAVHLDQGRDGLAEPLLVRARAILEGGEPRDAGDLVAVLNNLGILRKRQGRTDEAEALFLRAVEIDARLSGPDGPAAAGALTNLGLLLALRGRTAEAEGLLRRALATRERALGPAHPRLVPALTNLAVLDGVRGRHGEAERLLRRALAVQERAFGPGSPRTAPQLALLANLRGLEGRAAEAVAVARHASEAALRHGTAGAARGGPRTRASRAHVRAGWALVEADAASRTHLLDETFRAGQLAHASDAAASVARVAARFAAGGGPLAAVVRRQQDLADRWGELDRALVDAAAAGGADLEDLSRDLAETGAALAALDRELARSFPRYRALVDPAPLGLADAQALLGPDEALLAYLVLPAEPEWLEDGAAFLWALRPDRAALRRLDASPAELEAAVRSLRERLDPDRWPGPVPAAFDVAAAHRLHDRLIPPDIAALLDGARHLLVMPDGPLESLPFSLLVRSAPARATGYDEVDWLARTVATTTLPSVASLSALRRFAGSSGSPEPFRGVGDPLLAGHTGPGVAAALRELPPLPETADELRRLARRLGAGEESLLLGAAATERAVRAGALARARVVAFATHAGVAGQLPGLAEPALVLTPPAVATAEDDGLLTASEAAHLDLDADLVLLSACNTAAPDGTPGAPGLSGLANAFIHAGSRALLVSHWSVISDAARRLTTGMLAELARDPRPARAEALRRSMMALADDRSRPDLAHPAAWAPFVVVGQGGAPARFAPPAAASTPPRSATARRGGS